MEENTGDLKALIEQVRNASKRIVRKQLNRNSIYVLWKMTQIAQKRADSEGLLKSLDESLKNLDATVTEQHRIQTDMEQRIRDLKADTIKLVDQNCRKTTELQKEIATSSKMKATIDNMNETIDKISRESEQRALKEELEYMHFQSKFHTLCNGGVK